jgi:hypothetical protein
LIKRCDENIQRGARGFGVKQIKMDEMRTSIRRGCGGIIRPWLVYKWKQNMGVRKPPECPLVEREEK